MKLCVRPFVRTYKRLKSRAELSRTYVLTFDALTFDALTFDALTFDALTSASVARFVRTELKRGASKAKKSSEQFGVVHLSAAPQNRRSNRDLSQISRPKRSEQNPEKNFRWRKMK